MTEKIFKRFLGKKTSNFVKSFIRPKKLKINRNGRYFFVDSTKNYNFWKTFENGDWEPQTLEILDKFLDKNHSYIDMGAWIGPTSLYGCQIAKHCYAIEPDPNAFLELKKNIELNTHLISKITLSNYCISNSCGSTKLYTKNNYEFGDSRSSIWYDEESTFQEVKTTTFEQFMHDFSIIDCNFIKMDIEGAEFIILPTMLDYLKTCRPTVLLEIHYEQFMNNPIKNLEAIKNILKIYDDVCDEGFKKVNIESVLKKEISGDISCRVNRIILR